MYHKLLLDHAREWNRAAKSVQEDQIYVKDQMHPDRSGADRVQEQPIDRIKRKLRFTPQLFPIWLETVLRRILQKTFHQTLFKQQCPHWTLILKLLLLVLIQNQKKGRKLQIHLHLHWRWPRNQVLTLQDPESQQEGTLGSQPVHLVIFTCKDTTVSGTVDCQSKKLNFELYVMYTDKLAIFNSNHNRH